MKKETKTSTIKNSAKHIFKKSDFTNENECDENMKEKLQINYQLSITNYFLLRLISAESPILHIFISICAMNRP
jgi:hypothetical protein